MNQTENYLLSHNKLLEEKLDLCIHNIESRLDNHEISPANRGPTVFSTLSYLQFKAPYIRDSRNFSGPANDDVKQIRELKGTENIDILVKSKGWSKESKQQLNDAVLDHFSQVYILELIKQKNALVRQLQEATSQNRTDIESKLSLIEEQTEQVRARKEQRIFVPEDRQDQSIDWCAISAKLANTHHDPKDCRLMWSNKLHWSINDGPWTKEEDVCLLNAVQKYGKNDWNSVAKELNSSRLPWQCCSRYHQEFITSYCGPTPIDEDDTDKIIEVINLCRIGNYVPWNQVMYFIQYHSLLQVKYQWNKLMSDRVSARAWSHHEDVLLLTAVEKFGEREWNRIANYIPGRSNKSCRERYTMRLRFSTRSVGTWRRKEDESLLALVERFGTNWSLISSHFPERNNHQIRNRYELLKSDATKVGPIKHRKLHRDADGFLISLKGRKPKQPSDCEVDAKLEEIFSTYQTVKPTSRSLVYRSPQDELIYQSILQFVRQAMVGRGLVNDTLLSHVIQNALRERVTSDCELFTPCISTLRGYKAWLTQQDYLRQFADDTVDSNSITSSSEYHQVLKIAVSLFLWPAILSKIKRPEVNVEEFQVGTLIEKDKNNLYKIRDIQNKLAGT